MDETTKNWIGACVLFLIVFVTCSFGFSSCHRADLEFTKDMAEKGYVQKKVDKISGYGTVWVKSDDPPNK